MSAQSFSTIVLASVIWLWLDLALGRSANLAVGLGLKPASTPTPLRGQVAARVALLRALPLLLLLGVPPVLERWTASGGIGPVLPWLTAVAALFLIWRAALPRTHDPAATHELFGTPENAPAPDRSLAGLVRVYGVHAITSACLAMAVVSNFWLALMLSALSLALTLAPATALHRWLDALQHRQGVARGSLLVLGLGLAAQTLGTDFPQTLALLTLLLAWLATAVWVIHDATHRDTDPSHWRERAAATMRGLLRRTEPARHDDESPDSGVEPNVSSAEPQHMVSGVLSLVDRSVQSIMTPRADISWIDLDGDPQAIRRILTEVPHSFFPACRGSLDEVVGLGRARDLLADILTHQHIRPESLRPPLIVHQSISMLHLIDTLKQSRGQVVLITDEFGAIEGLVTPIDVFEAIAGEFPDEDELPDILPEGDGQWRVAGGADLHHLERELDASGLVHDDYATLAGYLLARFDQLPQPGQTQLSDDGLWEFEVLEVRDRRIVDVRVRRHDP